MYLVYMPLGGAEDVPYWMTLVAAILFGIGFSLYLERAVNKAVADAAVQRANLLARRYVRGDYQHLVLEITPEGLILDGPSGHSIFYREDEITTYSIGNDAPPYW
jgi:hypothetical protein